MKTKTIQNYSLYQVVGEGVYGKVYRAVNSDDNKDYAIKVIPVSKFQDNPKLEECTANEIKILSKIEPSPYLVRYVELQRTKNNFYFIYEYCNGKTLQYRLKQQGKLNETEALRIFGQLLQAFKVLNKYNIMHRDLKPDNIFFHNNDIKLGDFGFCKTLEKTNDMASTMLGSPIYMAPQVLNGEIYTSKADIWSLGVVLYQMLFGFCPYESNSIAKLISVLAENNLNMPLEVNNISPAAQDLLKKLLVKDHFKRIDWFQLLNYSLEGSSLTENGFTFLSDSSLCCTPLSDCSDKSPTGMQFLDTNNPQSSFKKKADEWSLVSPTKFLSPQAQPQLRLHKVKSIQGSQKSQFYSSGRKQSTMQILSKRKSLPQPSFKRRRILEMHSSCLTAVRTAIDFVKLDDPSGLVFGLIIFKKIENQLRRLCDSISSSDLDLEDILLTINTEIRQVQKQTQEVEKEVARQNSTRVYTSPKQIIKQKFSQKQEANRRLWYEMVCFLNDEKVNPKVSDRDCLNTILAYIL